MLLSPSRVDYKLAGAMPSKQFTVNTSAFLPSDRESIPANISIFIFCSNTTDLHSTSPKSRILVYMIKKSRVQPDSLTPKRSPCCEKQLKVADGEMKEGTSPVLCVSVSKPAGCCLGCCVGERYRCFTAADCCRYSCITVCTCLHISQLLAAAAGESANKQEMGAAPLHRTVTNQLWGRRGGLTGTMPSNVLSQADLGKQISTSSILHQFCCWLAMT